MLLVTSEVVNKFGHMEGSVIWTRIDRRSCGCVRYSFVLVGN